MISKGIYDIKELGFIPPVYGGISVSIIRLIQQLTKEGFVVGGFYSLENKNPEILQSELFDPELNLSIRRIVCEMPHDLRVLRPYKILHSHYSLEHMLYMWFFIKFLKIKMVITVHNSMVESFYKKCGFINRFFLKRIANNPDVIWIAVSDQVKKEMEQLPICFRSCINVIPAYIPEPNQERKHDLPQSLLSYINQHERIIVFYGHSFMQHNGKDVYGFIEALEMYSRIMHKTEYKTGLIICISTNKDDYMLAGLHQEAQRRNIDHRVFWQVGALANFSALWSKTDVYIRPTSTDGDSVAVREALDMGVCVVASDVCWRPDKVNTYVYGDMSGFCETVLKALSVGRRTVDYDYSNYDKIKDIYCRLLGN